MVHRTYMRVYARQLLGSVSLRCAPRKSVWVGDQVRPRITSPGAGVRFLRYNYRCCHCKYRKSDEWCQNNFIVYHKLSYSKYANKGFSAYSRLYAVTHFPIPQCPTVKIVLIRIHGTTTRYKVVLSLFTWSSSICPTVCKLIEVYWQTSVVWGRYYTQSF